MPFVKRDSSGRICGVFENQVEIGLDFLPPDDPEVVAFREVDPGSDIADDDVDYDEDDVYEEEEVIASDMPLRPEMPLEPSSTGDYDSDDDDHYDDLDDSAPIASDPISVRKRDLGDSDFALIRAIEDLISLLDKKGVISEGELPQPVQDLLERRRSIRRMVQEIHKTGLTEGL